MKIIEGILASFLGALAAFGAVMFAYCTFPGFASALRSAVGTNSSSSYSSASTEEVAPISLDNLTLSDSSVTDSSILDNNSFNNFTTTTDQPVTQIQTTHTPEVVLSPENITVSTSRNMTIGDVSDTGDLYVGLSHVKKVDKIRQESIINYGDFSADSDENIIVFFFDALCKSDGSEYFAPDHFSCYADSVRVDNIPGIVIDNVFTYSQFTLVPGTQAILPMAYAVPASWKKITIFYRDDYSWEISPQDISTNDFELKSMYSGDYSRPETPVGAVIYDKECRIVFDGHETYTQTGLDREYQFEVFKFTATNNSSDVYFLYGLFHWYFQAYQDNYAMMSDEAIYPNPFEGYLNPIEAEKLHPGTTVSFYLSYPSYRTGDFDCYLSSYMDDTENFYVYVKK